MSATCSGAFTSAYSAASDPVAGLGAASLCGGKREIKKKGRGRKGMKGGKRKRVRDPLTCCAPTYASDDKL